MKRAAVATAATVVGLVALLDYKSSGKLKQSNVTVGGGSGASSPTTAAPPTSTPAQGPTTTQPATTTQANYTSQDVFYRYGDIQIEITVAGGRITHISIPQEGATDPRSASINSQAIPILTREALAAQSLNFDVVSGATFTSDAFGQAFQEALSQAGK